MEANNHRKVEFETLNIKRKRELEHFLYVEYPRRYFHIVRCVHLGVEPDETLFNLDREAYFKEQEYRKIIGKKPLQELKNKKIL